MENTECQESEETDTKDGSSSTNLQGAQAHVNINDNQTKATENVESVESNCPIHDDKKLDMFCRTCDNAICERCAYLNHREKHNVVEIWEVINERAKQLTLDTDLLKHQIQTRFMEELLKIDFESDRVNESYSKTKQDIQVTLVNWHKEINEVGEHIFRDLNKMKEIHINRLLGEREKIENLLRELQQVVDENEKLLQTPMKIIDKGISVSTVETFKNFPQITMFDPPVFTLVTIKELLDESNFENEVAYTPTFHIPIKSAYKKSCLCLANLSNLNEKIIPGYAIPVGICTSPNFEVPSLKTTNNDILNDIKAFGEKAIVAFSGSSEAVNIDKEGSILRWQQMEGICFLSRNNEEAIYYTDSVGKRIVKTRFSTDKDITDQTALVLIADTEEWVPKGIAVTKKENIFVCLQKEGRGKLSKYDKELKKHVDFEFSKSNPLFDEPEHVTENRNGDICVTNIGSQASVVILDKNGEPRNIYRPRLASGYLTRFFSRKSFSPGGVCSDRMGQILVSDTPNRVIHVLDQWGEFLLFLLKGYLEDPRALSVDDCGQLWVVEGKKQIKIVKYLHGYITYPKQVNEDLK